MKSNNMKLYRCENLSSKLLPYFQPSNLDGALSTTGQVQYLYDTDEHELDVEDINIANYVTSDFSIDEKNKLFTNEHGAVVDAYKFYGPLSYENFVLEIKKIVYEHELLYPDYEFTLVEGEFPIEVIEAHGDNQKVPHVIMSDYVLYIKDYKKQLNPTSLKARHI